MNLSRPFVERPVATTLLTLGIALSGIIGFRMLPVSPLPQVDFPTISVSASLPGASPETMAATVATPLERALGRIAGVNEITSSSSLGNSRVVLQFDLNRDINGAARDVQAAINAARTLLPTGLPNNPTYRKVNPADAPIMIIALTSQTMTQGQMYDAAATVLQQKLSQVSGIGQVSVGGSSLPAVRVELNPMALQKYGIGFEDVRTVITSTNVNRPKGFLEGDQQRWQIGANDQAKKAADYMPLIVAYRNNAAVRMTDIGEVVDSVQDLRNAGSSNGKPSVLIILNRQPNANIIETVDRVRELLPELQASIPNAINLDVVLDRTPTIRTSLKEVERSLLISICLVIMVVFLFLRNARATLIPSVAVPVSLLGTFGVMHLCGYSLNNLSLMALTIATGFVVDDAIVVLENVSRRMEAGVPRRQAALEGAKEVGFTVLSMSVSLIAVFIPILLMGGIVGRYFREFAVVLSVAILVSLVVSLTTTPMMCATLLKPKREKKRGRFDRGAERVFNWVLSGYEKSLGWALRHGPLMIIILAVTIGLNVYLYTIIPKGFFPQQDTGRLIGFVRGDQSISFQAMRQKLARFIEIVQNDPAVTTVVGFTGGSGFGGSRNSGSMFVTLKPRSERDVSADQVVTRLRRDLEREPGANLFLQPVQDIRVGGRQGQAQWQFTLQADELEDLRKWEPPIRQALSRLPEIADVSTDQQDRGLQTSLVIDRDTASRLGITPRMIDAALNNAFGQRQVSTIYNPLNQYRVVMEAAPQYWQSPEALGSLYIILGNGNQIPFSAFSRYEMTNTPLAVSHQGQFPATTVSFNLMEGVSLSQARDAVFQELARIGVPTTIHGTFQGTARVFEQTTKNQPWLIVTALLTVYIVLGILYESLVHPITILSTLPSAGVGALLALLMFNTEFTIIAMIGVILLIGIVKKNAIMMIDFALDLERREGMAPRDAIYRACLMRFRPIMMTTMAAMFGALPLAFGFGEGSELRKPLGISIVGGLLVSQLLTLYTTPVVYLYLDRMRQWAAIRRQPRRPVNEQRETQVSLRNLPSFVIAMLAITLLLATGGCTHVGPDFSRPKAEVPATYKEMAGWKQAEPRDHELKGSWWELYDDPVLTSLAEQVNVSNQTLAQSQAQYRQARALLAQARAAYFPTLGASASVARSQSSGALSSATTTNPAPRTTHELALDASWEPDLWGRVARTVEASIASAEASKADVENVRLSLQAQLAQSYFLLRALEAQQQILDDTVQAFEQSLKLTQNRYNSGVVARADVVQAQAQLRTTQAQAIDLGVQRAQIEHAIAVLVGKPPADLSLPRAPLAGALPAIPVALPSELLERRPDIASAERRVESANAQIGVARAAYFPSLTLSASGGFQSSALSHLLTAPARFWSLGAALAQTIFDAGLRRARTEQAIAVYDQTVAQYRQTVLTGFQEVEDNLAALRILEQEARVQAEAVTAARQAVDITLNQYKAGTVSYINVLQAQTTALNSERTAVDIQNRRYAASVLLIRALGGGWTAASPAGSGQITRQP